MHKQACSTTESTQKIEILQVARLSLVMKFFNKQITKELIRLRWIASWSAPLLFANPEDRFSHVENQMNSELAYNQKLILCK